MRGRRRGPVARVRRHPVRVDVVRRPAGRCLHADCAPNAESHFKPDAAADACAQRAPNAPTDVDADAAADARAQQATDAIADARTLAEANTAAHTYADAAPIAVADHHSRRPDGAPGLQSDAAADAPADTDTIALAHAPADAAPDASADTYTLALADGAADASAKPSAVAAAVYVVTHAAPIALAVSETRKSDGVARLRSDAAADAHPDEQPDASSRILLLGRRLRRLYGGVDGSGLLERKRSVRERLR